MIVKDEDLTGKNLSNYKVIGKLGQGGMAVVYKAHELSLNRMVALKVLSSRLAGNHDYIKRFQREARAAAQLNHPNIVQIYAIGEENGIFYFAMEYIKGQSLAEIKQKQGAMAPGQAAAIIKPVADALGEAHRAGLVHRDIKPSNIMIDAMGRPKVTDFGIAYVVAAETKLTREGSVIGTPEYLSPEQCEGKTVDQRSDIYSLGVTLYELLTGRTPYEADTPVSMLMKIVKGEFPPISQVKPGIPAPLCTIVEKMMETDVNKRYQDMSQVVAALDEYEKGAPGVTVREPATLAYHEIDAQQGEAPHAKNGKWAAILVAAVIVILMGGAFAARMLFFDKEAADTAPSLAATTTNTATGPPPATPPPPATGTDAAASTSTQTQSTQPDEVQSDEVQPEAAEPGVSSEETGSTQLSQSQQPQSPAATGTAAAGQTQRGAVTAAPTGPGSQPSPKQPASARPQKTAAPAPAANTVLISSIGDEDKADLITPYVQEILTADNFRIIDGPTAADRDIASVARNHLVITVKQLGGTTLQYYGSSSQQYTVRLTIKIVNPRTGKITAGPASRVVEYTALNADENLREAAAELIARIRSAL